MSKEHERIVKDLNEKLAVEKQAKLSLESKLARVES